MACLYRSLDEFHQDDSILEMLKTHRMLPLSDGELVSLKDKAVFYPIQSSSDDKKRGRGIIFAWITLCVFRILFIQISKVYASAFCLIESVKA